MNKFGVTLLALLFYALYAGLADCSTDPLKVIADTCIEQPLEVCENHIVGQGVTRDAFILIVKFIKTHKKVMALYESRFGLDEVKRFNKLMSFKPVLPDASQYTVSHVDKNERLYIGKRGDRVTLSKIAGTWKIDMEKSHLDTSHPAEQIRLFRILLGFYHDLQKRLEQRQSLEAVERATLLSFAGIFYYDVPSDQVEMKESFRKVLSQNDTTPEEIQKQFLKIADQL